MKARVHLFVVLLVSVLVMAAGVGAPVHGLAAPRPRPGFSEAGSPIAGELIVAFRRGTPESLRDVALGAVGASEVREFPEIGAELVKLPPGIADLAIKFLERRGIVRYAEPNALLYADSHGGTPNDPSFHDLYGMENFGQTVNGVTGVADADIDAAAAWSSGTGSSDVVVGVIDTGVDFGHPDLGGSMTSSPLMWINPGEDCPGCRADGVDNDANGYVDDWRGWDWANNDNNPFDDNGHGSHVAGTIGAIGNNGTGVAGVNWNVRIMALKFLNSSGSGSTSNAISAILYAKNKGVPVTNNSWGGGGYSQALQDAINQADGAGSLFVAAAGNSNVDTDVTPHYPSSYTGANVLSVAATDSRDLKASFSNYGKKTVDLGAPGANIYSTYAGSTYRYLNGTSMATPHVAGAAALLKSLFPGASHLGIKALLLRSVDPNAALAGRSTSEGRLNVGTAASCSGQPKVWIESPAPGFQVGSGDALSIQVLAGNCASASGVTVSATANGSPIALTARGDGLYTATYVPAGGGPLVIEASATVGTATDARSVAGSVLGNYRYEDAAYAWIDATAGTKTGIASNNTSATVSLPFPFTYYDQPFTSVKVSSNGHLVFGPSSASAYSNVAIPNTGSPNGIVAALWDDLNPGSGGGVYHHTTGTSPNRLFTLAWVDVPRYSNVGTATFEVILAEGSNDIFFQYKDVNFGSSSYDFGASATIGVEDLTGSKGRQFSHNQATLQSYEGAKGIRFTQSDATSPPPPTPPPAAPTLAGATAMSSSQIDLSWTNVADETGYRVERSADGTTGWAQVGATAADVTSFSNGGLAGGTAYHYRVFATNGGGDSSSSNVESATTKPDAPAGLVATSVSASRIDLSWTGTTGATSYRVERSTGSSWATAGTSTGTSFSDTGLAAGTGYQFRVVAVGVSGDSAPTAQVTQWTRPSAPTLSSAVAASSSRIDLSWTNVAGETGYRIERSPDGSTGWTQVGATAADATTFSDTGLSAETTYHYRVFATNSGGESGASGALSATTPASSGTPTTSYSVTQVQIQKGQSLGDPISHLHADDALRYGIASSGDGSHAIRWWGATTIGVTGVTRLTFTWDGHYDPSATVTARVYDYTSGNWVTISLVCFPNGADQTCRWSTTNVSRYISSSRQVRFRLMTSASVPHTARNDLWQVTVEHG